MHPIPETLRAAANGAVGGAAAAALLGLVLALTTLFTGGHLALPELIDATGGTTNGAASVELTLGWTMLVVAAVLGAVANCARVRTNGSAATPTGRQWGRRPTRWGPGAGSRA